MTSPTKWTVPTTGLLGLWLLTASFTFGAPGIAQWNDVLVGCVILVVAGYNYFRERMQGILSRRAAAVNGLLGVWLLVAPFMYEISDILLWNDIIVGVGVTSLAMYNIYAVPRIQGARVQSPPEEI